MNSSDSTNKRSRHDNDMGDENIEEEVQKILRKSNGKLTQNDLIRMRSKYNDEETADKVLDALTKKYKSISKKAKKFAQLIREKYSNNQYPFHVLLEKARLFKVKHGLTDDEFNEFQRIYELELVGKKSSEVIIPSTNMSKLLGSFTTNYEGFTNHLNDTDYKYLQEVIALHAQTRTLHSQVILQSSLYEDCAFEATNGGVIHPELGQRPGDSIHPIIAALFLPRINGLEEHFLYSNMFNVIKTRYNNEPLVTRPDFMLFHALTSDPNDVVCDSRSSMSDLLNRCKVQHQLWNNVLNLRNGLYFNSSFREFISSIDMCKLNKQDSPDLVYGRYDGTILKRLLTSFSYRPTIVATSPLYTMQNMNPYQQNMRPVVTNIPMINLRLPPIINTKDDDEIVELSDVFEQHQFFIENGVMVPRHTSLIYSRDVLFIYVERRINIMSPLSSTPIYFNMGSLPVAMSGLDSINKRRVSYQNEFTIRGDKYQLRSVVLSEVDNNGDKEVVIGSSALILAYPKEMYTGIDYLLYNPLRAGILVYDGEGPSPNPAITVPEDLHGVGDEAVTDMVQQRGIIFMYQLVQDRTEGRIPY